MVYSSDEILARTDGGKTVFVHYFGSICENKEFINPFRNDSRPSCHLYLHKNKKGLPTWYMQDFGDSRWCGDCFCIVARIANLSVRHQFVDVLRVIDRELCLGLGDGHSVSSTTSRIQVPKKEAKTERPKPIAYIPVFRDFTSEELAYWEGYGIGPDILSMFDVKSVGSCEFRRTNGTTWTIVSTRLTPCYAYVFDDMGVKFYRPKSDPRFLYAGILPHPYVFGWQQLPDNGEYVFLTGGEKDAMSLTAHGFPAISLNSETASIPDNLLLQLEFRFKYIVFCYDMDETGQRESKARVMEFSMDNQVMCIDLPLPGTKQAKDISDFFRLGHTPEELQTILQNHKDNNK